MSSTNIIMILFPNCVYCLFLFMTRSEQRRNLIVFEDQTWNPGYAN
jgi:hypothetical protein